MSAPRIVAVILAAGISSRMGRNKLVLDLCGRPVIERVVSLARAAGRISSRVLVASQELYHHLRSVDRSLLEGLIVVVNGWPGRGLSYSVRLGVEAAGDADAYMFFNADMPFIRKRTVETLIDAYLEGGALIVAPRYRGRRGLPVIVDSSLRGELLRLRGDVGARAIMERRPEYVRYVDVDDEFILFDIDEPSDLERARSLCSEAGSP